MTANQTERSGESHWFDYTARVFQGIGIAGAAVFWLSIGGNRSAVRCKAVVYLYRRAACRHLEDSRQLDDTASRFTSDHGYFLGE